MSFENRVSKNRGRVRTGEDTLSKTKRGNNVHEIVFDSQRRSELLLSKSNYQLLMEGESAQAGISFPPSIMDNLSTKRATGTIAERARRKELKNALEELATLLSQDCCGEGSQKMYAVSNAGKYAKVQPMTKVSTVELAIEYIKCLRKEVAGSRSTTDGYFESEQQFTQ